MGGWDSQHATHRGDGGEEVDIVELWHMHVEEIGERVSTLRGVLQHVQDLFVRTIDKRIEMKKSGSRKEETSLANMFM